MTTVDIAEGRRLLAAATPGPWRNGAKIIVTDWRVPVPGESFVKAEKVIGDSPARDEDAALIVWLRNNAEALLAGTPTWPSRDEVAAMSDAEAADEYERRVQQMAEAIHEDCILRWRAIVAVDPKRQFTQHAIDAHYGQAHNLVRRIFGDGAPAATKTNWKYDSRCEVTEETHSQGSACEPFYPHSHRSGTIKWARRLTEAPDGR